MKMFLLISTIFFSQFASASVYAVSELSYSNGSYYVKVYFNNWYADYWPAYYAGLAKCQTINQVIGKSTYINYQNAYFIGLFYCKKP